MKAHNAENERIKRRYLAYLKEAMRHSEPTLDVVTKSLARFEAYTKYKDFKAFHYQQAVAFKNYLAEQKGEGTGKKLSKATLNATLANLKRFFHWLAGQPGYKSRIQYCDADYFNLSEKDVRVATAKREKKAPTLEQVKHVITNMPLGDEIARRNRALVAFTLLTGARDSAIASMKLKHVDVVEGSIFQDAREVSTKFSKTFTTYFFPVGEEIKTILVDWVAYLRDEKLWGNNDPLFPSTLMQRSASRQFEVAGLKREHWSNASPIRKIFREAFERAGLPYYNPHSFRHMLVRYGQQVCKTPEDYKAWSQNLGHEKVLTTFLSYGDVECRRQGEIIGGLGKASVGIQNVDIDSLAEALAHKLKASSG
ncbi:MAG: tyrosine-type recombinase/integrase [Cellvibrio sp.]|uniref:tyrosine-type recombinase/integrase n=1 Tax=Cellvibrio sp. TaxID=1965322 RepID=UPI0031A4E0C5